MITPDHVRRFMELFPCNERSFGQCQKTRAGKYKQWTEKKRAVFSDFERHITGAIGVGAVAIRDDSTVRWGAIDIDAHGDTEDINLSDLVSAINEFGLPLVVCRSKSGGAHCYLFTSEPVEASLIRITLASWAKKIGYPGVEIFPKQSHLRVQGDGGRPLGNWINLCYAGGDNTDRYAVKSGGDRMTLEYFMETAENLSTSKGDLSKFSAGEHGEAPPCIQKIMSAGVPSGTRNEALYNVTVYLKKARPNEYRDTAFDLNSTMFDKPLPHAEAKRTIASASRRDYKYRCGEDPCKRYCDREVCMTRRFGITVEESIELSMPEFGPIKKYLTDPVKWGVSVDGKELIVSTPVLMDYRRMTEAVVDGLTKIIPIMKNLEWQRILNELMVNVKLVEAPDDASTPGVIRSRLIQFIKKADSDSDDLTSLEARAPLTRGIPVVLEYDDKKCVFFRGSDFVDYLKRTRSEELKGSSLWMALRKLGIQHTRIRAGHGVVTAWYIEISGESDDGGFEYDFVKDVEF